MSRIPPRQSGLPADVDSLVGRKHEIAAVLERLGTARVVTLTGPGGCGKTRLALRVAALAEADFGDGARLAELAPRSRAVARQPRPAPRRPSAARQPGPGTGSTR